jgi:restriction system protein
MDKSLELSRIRDKRVEVTYEGFFKLEDFSLGDEDGGHLSPFTKSSANIDSDIMVVLQDWASEDFIKKGLSKEVLELGHNPKLRTNINLKSLLVTHFNKELKDIYSTNLFPYIKKGAMNSGIPAKYMKRAASDFLIPTMQIIKPKLVVCLGLSVFNATRQALGLPKVANLEEAINSHVLFEDVIIFCQAHTGAQGQNNRNKGGVARVPSDWRLMKRIYESI